MLQSINYSIISIRSSRDITSLAVLQTDIEEEKILYNFFFRISAAKSSPRHLNDRMKTEHSQEADFV